MYETEYLKLKVAQEDDFYNINEHAENMEKIDGKLKEVKETEERLRELVEEETERARSAETKNAEDIEKVSSSLTSEINNKISDLIGGAPETLDTLKEIADAIAENETIVDALNEAIGKKVNIDDFNTQMTNLGKSVAEGKQLLAATLSGWGPNPVASDAAFGVLNSAINTTVGTYGDNRYNQGYVKGVQDADGRALPGSVNYQSGYNQGASDKHTELVNLQHSSLVSGSGAFGAWVAMWVMPNNKTDLHRYTNTGTWKTVYAGNQGDRRIVLGVGYGDINQCVSPASADLVAIWAI